MFFDAWVLVAVHLLHSPVAFQLILLPQKGASLLKSVFHCDEARVGVICVRLFVCMYIYIYICIRYCC